MKSFNLIILSLIFLFIGCEEKPMPKQINDKPFKNQTIMVIVPTLHAGLIRGPIMEEAEKFQEKTGAKIRVVTPTWNETINKTKQSLEDPDLNFDIFVVISMWNGMLLSGNHIAEVPEYIKNKIDWDDVLPIYKNTVLSYNNKTYGLPYDGDCINLYYRKDIFENEEIKKKYFQKYKKELSVPKTWDEYKIVANFFTNWDWDNDGKIEYGNAILRKKEDIAMLQFFATAAAYAKHPNDKSYFFNEEDMTPRINNQAFIKALEDYKELLKYAPNGAINFAGHDVRNSFVTGEVAMAIDWADLGIYAAENKISSLEGSQVGYAQIPASNKVFNAKTNKWENKFNQVSSISGNWSLFINKNSKNKKLAFEFAAHMSSKEMTKKLVAKSGNAINPSRYSHFKNPKDWEKSGFTEESAKRYLDTITQSLTNKNVVYDITIPGAGEYYQALDNFVYKTLKNELSVKEALDRTYIQWEKITNKLNREKQIRYYKSSLN